MLRVDYESEGATTGVCGTPNNTQSLRDCRGYVQSSWRPAKGHGPYTPPSSNTSSLQSSPPHVKILEHPGGQNGASTTERKRAQAPKASRKAQKYWENAPFERLKHPLEENIFITLVITLVAVAAALIIGIPILLIAGILLSIALTARYALFIFSSVYSYIELLVCWNRPTSTSRRMPPRYAVPRARMAFANDTRWLGRRNKASTQSILHTLLVFQGSVDLASLRHLIQSRVLHAETYEGELAYPRLLHRLVPVASGWKWERDTRFDIENHVFPARAKIHSESQVQRYIQSLLMERMSFGKPLWEVRVVTSYGAQKDTLLIVRVHQSLADGMSLVRILCHSLADQQQLHVPQRPHFAGLNFGFNAIRALIVGPLTLLLWLFAITKDRNVFTYPFKQPDLLEKRKRESSWTHWRVGRDPGPRKDVERGGTKTENKGKKTARKLANKRSLWNVIWAAPLTVAKVTRVKQIMRSSFNDVMLAAAAGSARAYLQEQGVPCPKDIKVSAYIHTLK